MCVKSPVEFFQLETQLTSLIAHYKIQPSNTLALTINDCLKRLLNHADIDFCCDKQCDYVNMYKFWRWQTSII